MSAVVLPAGPDTSVRATSARSSEDAASRDASPVPVRLGTAAMSQRPPTVASVTLRGSPTLVALDNDGDSLAHQLLLRVPLHVHLAGDYWLILPSHRGN